MSKLIDKELIKKSSLTEATTLASISVFNDQIPKLISKSYSKDALTPLIADVQEQGSPLFQAMSSAVVYNFHDDDITGSDTFSIDNSKLIRLNVQASLTLGNTYTLSNAATIRVIYHDATAKQALIQIISGTFNPDTTFTDEGSTIITVTSITANLYGIRSFFRAYSTPTSDTSAVNEFSYVVKTDTISRNTTKVKTNFTLEALQDFEIAYGNKKLDKIIESDFAPLLDREVDVKVLDFAKTSAKNIGTLDPVALFGNGTDVKSLGDTIYFNSINMISDMSSHTKTSKEYVLVASLRTAGILMLSNGVMRKPEFEDNTFYVGHLAGIIPIYIDPYTEKDEEYVMALRKGTGVGDAGIIYTPYARNIIKDEPDINTGASTVYVSERSGWLLNTFGGESGDTSLVNMFSVDLSSFGSALI